MDEEYDDEYDRDPCEDDCDHEDYEADILSGRAMCHRCGHTWYQTQEEIEREIKHQKQYAEWERRETCRQWWCDLWCRVRSIIPQRKRALADDEIPF